MRTYNLSRNIGIKLVSSFLFLLIAFTSQAQVSAGIKFGRNAANVNLGGSGDAMLNTKFISNYNFGLVGELELTEVSDFAIQAELNFISKGFKVKEGFAVDILNLDLPLGVEAHTRIKYVELPVLGKYSFGDERKGAYLLAGPYFAYARKARLETKANVIININVYSTDIDLSNETYNRFDVGAMGGAGLWAKAGSGKFFADVRYQHSLNEMFNDMTIDIQMQNSGFGVNAGYLMNF